MSSVAGVAASGYTHATTYPQSTTTATPAVQQQQPAAYDPDHDGDQDTPGRVDTKA